jgi:hypothetical protein
MSLGLKTIGLTKTNLGQNGKISLSNGGSWAENCLSALFEGCALCLDAIRRWETSAMQER